MYLKNRSENVYMIEFYAYLPIYKCIFSSFRIKVGSGFFSPAKPDLDARKKISDPHSGPYLKGPDEIPCELVLLCIAGVWDALLNFGVG